MSCSTESVGGQCLCRRARASAVLMLLTISTTHRPATVLGRLLHHHFDDIDMTQLPFGHAMVCFSQADEGRCTAAVMVHAHHEGSSQLGVALAEVFGPAIHGYGETEPALAGQALPFEVEAPVLPTMGGSALIRRLFEPLGYDVATGPVPHDAPAAADAPGELAVTLSAELRVAELLSHLSVLLPVLDDSSHMGISDEAVLDALLVEGQAWITTHPASAYIIRRYASHPWPGSHQHPRTA